MLRHAAACFKPPTNRLPKQVLRHDAACFDRWWLDRGWGGGLGPAREGVRPCYKRSGVNPPPLLQPHLPAHGLRAISIHGSTTQRVFSRVL